MNATEWVTDNVEPLMGVYHNCKHIRYLYSSVPNCVRKIISLTIAVVHITLWYCGSVKCCICLNSNSKEMAILMLLTCLILLKSYCMNDQLQCASMKFDRRVNCAHLGVCELKLQQQSCNYSKWHLPSFATFSRKNVCKNVLATVVSKPLLWFVGCMGNKRSKMMIFFSFFLNTWTHSTCTFR